MASQVQYYALLIGIDAYPDRPLRHCVNNLHIIKDALNLQKSPPVEFNILTATASPGGGLLETKRDWPTTTNVKTALENLSRKVKKGDCVFIYYSGHGSHIPPPDTLPSTDKTSILENELGFVLLGDDLKTSTDWPGYEFGKHLHALSEVNHAVITVVVDCEWKLPLYPSEGWYNALTQSRNSEREDMWPFNAKGYTVLAAFQADAEIKVRDLVFGKLSFFIYEFALRRGLREKHKDLYTHLLLKFQNTAAVAGSSVPRMPMLFDGGNQCLFGEDLALGLVLNAAEAHGFCAGDELLLHPRAALPSGRTRMARPAAIIQTNALTSTFTQRDLDPAGDWVAEPRSRLRLHEFPVYLDPSIPDQVGMRNSLSASGLFAHGDDTKNYQYRLTLVGDDGKHPSHFDILDPSGKSIISHQLNLLAEEHAEDLADVLVHLVKFSLVASLTNTNFPGLQAIDFRASFDIYVETAPGTRYNPGQRIELQDRNTRQSTFFLHLVNYRDIPLHIYILALGSCWDIRSMHQAILEPAKDASDPTRLRKPMRTTVPPELGDGTPCDDIVKVFVTTYPTSLDILLQSTIEMRERKTRVTTTEQKTQWLTLGPAQPRRETAVPEQWDAFNFPIRTTRQSREANSTAETQADDDFPQFHEYASTETSNAFSSHQPDSTVPTTVSENSIVEAENAPGDRSLVTLFNYRGKVAAKPDELDDVQSLNSVEGDVESTAESSSWAGIYLETAVNFVVLTFTRDPELLALYQQVIAGMDTSKFVRNHQRLLRTYFLDLHSHGGSSPSQQVAIWFFRSRSRRTRVSSAIHHALTSIDDTMREKIGILVEDDDYALSRYLDGIDFASAPVHTIDADVQSDAESETSTDEMSRDESEAEEENALSKLEATGDFLTAGPPFRLFKQNFRRFSQPTSGVVSSQVAAPDEQEDDDLPSIRLGNLDYAVRFARGLPLTVWDSTKRRVELIAGRPLSWWPLSNPEDELRADHTRVYSTPSKTFPGQFYDDIPKSLAVRIFPKLLGPVVSERGWRYAMSSHKAVFLRNTTLMHVLQDWRSASRRGQQQQKAGEQINLSSQPAKNDSQSSPNQHTPAQDGVERKEEDRASQQSEESIVFMSADMRPNESIACAVDLGANDKTTFQNLQLAHRKFPSWGWKRATGIRFYRVKCPLTSVRTERRLIVAIQFRSFHFKESLKRHHVDIDKDRERYPMKDESEYHSYKYEPSPWQDGTPCPCLSGEAWYFLQHPDECGTSRLLNDTLPVRRHGTTGSRFTAWGLYIEQRHSVLAIFIPTLAMIVATLSATLWFVKPWLEDHPGDLQNATVPVIVAVTTLSMLLQLLTSLLVFRWSV